MFPNEQQERVQQQRADQQRANLRATIIALVLGACLAFGFEWWSWTGILNTHLQGQRRAELYGHAALLALGLTLITGLLGRWIRWLPRARRGLGLLGSAYSVLHTAYALEHSLGGSLESISFLTPERQAATALGLIALALLVPLTATSSVRAMRTLGTRWFLLHRLAAPAALLAAIHTAWMGAHYGLELKASTLTLALLVLIVVLTRAVHKSNSSSKTFRKDTR